MKKETLLLSNIKKDLKIIIKFQMDNLGDWKLSYIVPFTILSVLLGVFFENVLIALLVFSVAAYHIVRYIIEYRDCSIKKKAIMNAIDRSDICISTEKLSHIATEAIYEPHVAGGRMSTHKHIAYYKHVTYYYFEAGRRWRVPTVSKHYKWSKDYYLSSQGLENISIPGNEFYFISLKDDHDIAYIYPCKMFELEAMLKKDH